MDHMPDVRWMCPCGRFVADANIESRDRVAGPTVITETRYWCSRCGVRRDMPWLVEVGTLPLPTTPGPGRG